MESYPGRQTCEVVADRYDEFKRIVEKNGDKII